MKLRVLLGAAGVALGLFGVFRIVTQTSHHALVALVLWLVAAVVAHDIILSAGVLGIGALLSRVIPRRALPFVQGALLSGALVTIVALPLIYRQHLYPASKALLRQDYRVNLVILLVLVAVVSVALYVLRLVRTRATNDRPDADQDSAAS